MTIDSGHTAWLLVSTALVMLMTPGLAFFYGGMARTDGVLTLMFQNFVALGVISVLWFIVGFSLAFGEDAGQVIGNPATFPFMMNLGAGPMMIDGSIIIDGIPGLLFACYQNMFAVITPALMTGAFMDRMRFGPYLLFISLWVLLIYCPVCHWVWGGGFLFEWGFKDFAGGIVVHITAGFSGLATLVVVGSRPSHIRDSHEAHNIPHVLLGTGLLWFGWFGFNGGGALAANGLAAFAFFNTNLAAGTGLLTWCVIDWFHRGKPSLSGGCIGAVVGLVSITPGSGFVQPWAAVVIAVISVCCCYFSCELRKRFKFDDALDAFGCHGVGGFVGSVLLGCFADPAVGGVGVSGVFFGKQLAVSLFVPAYSMIVTILILSGISFFLVIKPEETDEGLDASQHGEKAYVARVESVVVREGEKTNPNGTSTELTPKKVNPAEFDI